MFQRIRGFCHDILIAVDFKRHEKSEFAAHEKEANRRFDNRAERTEINSINRKVKEEADSRFSQSIARWSAKLKEIEGDLSALNGMLQVFNRTYSEEISSLYDQKSALYERKQELFGKMADIKSRLSSAHNAKSQAYDDLSSAKSSIDAWHSKSKRGFFGNAGRELPKHSLFGQSFGDLDYHKSQSGQAGSEIQYHKRSISRLVDERSSTYRKISELKSDIEKAKADIQNAKDDRQRMYDLKRAGHTIPKMELELKLQCRNQGDAKEELQILQSKRELYMRSQEEKYGLSDVVNKSENLKKRRTAFIQSFTEPSHIEERKRVHRQKWLAERAL